MATDGRKFHAAVCLFLAGSIMAPPVFGQIDFSGEWAVRLHEDSPTRRNPPGAQIGEYLGLPINEAARLRADTWDAGILTLREHQTSEHTSPYMIRGGNLRISKVVDDASQQVIAFKILCAANPYATRTIWMDGRSHPPEYAAHTWQGFSTGKWEADTLTVETTHIKAGLIQSNGVPHSERATLIEHFIRHGDYLTVVGIVNDPAYLEEPFIRSSNYVMDAHQRLGPNPFEIVDEIAGRPDGNIPHHLPGTNAFLREFSEHSGIPFAATRGGKETTYPEYRLTLKRMLSNLPKSAGE